MSLPADHHARHARTVAEAKLLYALLDAADSWHLLRAEALAQEWRAVKTRLSGTSYEAEAETLFQLMAELDRSGALTSTWLRSRWSALEKRVSDPGHARESRAPW